MHSTDILQTVAEVAIALAGFSGVVVALGRRDSRDWTSEELLRLRTLVEPSLIALFGSFLPGTIQLVVEPETLVWKSSNAVFCLMGLIGLVRFLMRARLASTTIGQRVLVVIVALAVVIAGLSAVDVITQHELVFVSSLILALVVAAYNFILLLFPPRGFS